MMLQAIDVGLSVIALVFATAAFGKLWSPKQFLTAVERYELLPRRVVPFVAGGIVAGELAVAATHLIGRATLFGSCLGMFLLIAFAFAVSVTVRQHRLIPCGCFPGDMETVSYRTLIRIASLLALELFVFAALIAGRNQARDARVVDIRALIVAMIAVQGAMWVLIAPDVARLSVRLLRRINEREPVQ